MKLIATREVDLSEIAPDQGITHEGKRYIIDEWRRTREGFVLSCISEENPAVSRRKTLTFTGDDKVVVEAGEDDRRALLDGIQRILAGDDHTLVPGVDKLEYDAKLGTLSLLLGGWHVLIEA